MTDLRELAASMHCWEPRSDTNDFQRRARLLQAMWRQEHGMPMGEYRGKLRGSHLAMPWAKQSLANFISEDAKEVVRNTLDGGKRQKGSLIRPDRMYGNLLSSQPLAFNLFGPLQRNLDLATSVFAQMLPRRCARVTKIAFEFSPGRKDVRYTHDGSAFDVCVWFDTPEGGRGFTGIEVKYHENLNEEADDHRRRYDEVATAMGCFRPQGREQLRCRPLQQIWRDHLLAGAYRLVDGFADGIFAYLCPADNPACNDAIAQYRSCLVNQDSFAHWSLESFVEAVQSNTAQSWVREFSERYLAFDKLEALLEQKSAGSSMT